MAPLVAVPLPPSSLQRQLGCRANWPKPHPKCCPPWHPSSFLLSLERLGYLGLLADPSEPGVETRGLKFSTETL